MGKMVFFLKIEHITSVLSTSLRMIFFALHFIWLYTVCTRICFDLLGERIKSSYSLHKWFVSFLNNSKSFAINAYTTLYYCLNNYHIYHIMSQLYSG